MTAYSFICFVIVSLYLMGISDCAKLSVTFDSSTYDTYLPNVMFIQNTAYTFPLCMEICYRFTFCKSVNYHKGSKMCLLNYQAADPPGTIQPRYSTVPRTGYLYMDKANFPVMPIKQECLDLSCSLENFCVGSTGCSQWLYNDCGMVDEDPYATTEYPVNGDFDTAIHTCLRAPKGFTGVTTWTCNKKTGKWSAPEVPCPTYCLSPPKVREEQVVRVFSTGYSTEAYYSCSSYPDTEVTPSCLRSHCYFRENWSWYQPLKLSCSPNDCWTKGTYYRGGVSCTTNGRTCQRWDTDYPHIPTTLPENASEQQNYCRTDGFHRPWCYTTDRNMIWDVCDVQEC